MVGRRFGATLVVAIAVTGALAGCGGDSSADAPEPTGAASTSPAAPVLSDTGFGELKLGMSLAETKATGLLGKPVSPTGEICDHYSGTNGVDALYFTDDQLIIIGVGPKVRLDTGVGVGDTYQELHDAYGDRLEPDGGMGRVYVDAPNAPFPAHYRVGVEGGPAFRDSKITEIALQPKEFGCYE